MVLGYEVSEDGTLTPVELSKDSLDSTRVLCVVDDATKSIYLWKGTQANIRAKFVGARVATNLRTEYGFHFKVKAVDEGEEPPTFFSALDGSTAATPVMKPGQPTPPRQTATTSTPPPTPKTAAAATSAPETTTATTTPPPTTRAATTVSPPQATSTGPSRSAETTQPPQPPPVRTAVTSTSVPSASAATARTAQAAPASAAEMSPELREMIAELERTDPPEGYQRELLIVYNEIFTVAEHKVKVFGQEKIERRFEKVRDPPEGTFMAEGFIPRVIVKDGRVLGIELLKGTPDAILSPIKAEMRERLGDLISFFRSELEETESTGATTEGKKPAKRKLVAK